MIQQRNSIAWLKFNGAIRCAMVHTVSGLLPLYIVNEYPKSGGTWLGLMLSESLSVPFSRNRLPKLERSIFHGHYICSWNMKNVCVLWRDGRDVITSLYYHSLFKNEKGNHLLVDLVRKDLQFKDYDDIKSNLPAFIEYIFTRAISPRFNWSEFVDAWENKKAVHVKYEDLRADTSGQLIRITSELGSKELTAIHAEEIAEKYSFEKMSGRKPGQQNSGSFMRKGIVGDWKNHFSQDARKIFDHYAGQQLIKLGYEKNTDWVYDPSS